MKALIGDRGIRLTKSLGQNFLHDGNQLRRIVDAARLEPRDRVLEIGPGLGPLTELLLARAGDVLAIEKDQRLVEILRQRFAGESKLQLIHADALEFLQNEKRSWSDWKLVANLPYSVASPILVELAKTGAGPICMSVTLQMEVAKRLCAKPGDADYGLLTILVQADYQPQRWFKIPASCFWPPPDIDSACIELTRRATSLTGGNREVFVELVKRAFSQRRKMMLKLLKTDWPEAALAAGFAKLGLAPDVRAETVPIERFAALASMLGRADRPSENSLAKQTAAPDPQTVEEIFDVVDAEDRVIDRRTRAEVHRLGLMHRAVHVLIFNRAGKIFLQKRSMKKDRQPGLWDSSASGHVDSGEDYDACAGRELQEELGFASTVPLERLFKLSASPATDQEHVWVYRGHAEGPFTLHPDEIERGDWFDPGELTRWMQDRPEDFASGFRVIWARCSAEDGAPGRKA